LNAPPNNGLGKGSGKQPSSRESVGISRSGTMLIKHNSSGVVILVRQPGPQGFILVNK